jgi:hypothetical protein
MKNIDKTIQKYKTVLKNQKHVSMINILSEIKDLLKEIADQNKDPETEISEKIKEAFSRGQPEFSECINEVLSKYGNQDNVLLLTRVCQKGEYELLVSEDMFESSKLDKPLDHWWLNTEDAQKHKNNGESMVTCKIPVNSICHINNPVMIKNTVNNLTLDGEKTANMSFSVEPGSYKITEKYNGDW